MWQRAIALARTVYSATKQFLREELFGLTSQLRRSSVSIPSNIAEGQGRGSDGSFALFLAQAQGSLYELETQVELSRDLQLMPSGQAEEILLNASDIGKMIHGLLRTLRNPSRQTPN